MKTLALVLAICLTGSLHAAENDSARLLEAALQSNEPYELLQQLADGIGPRLSGSANADAAVRWAEKSFRSWGYEPRLEKVMVPHWVRGAESGSLVSHRNQRIILTALGGSVATPPDGIIADVIEVSSFDELKERSAEVKGKIVLYNKAMNLERVRAGQAFDAYGEVASLRSKGAMEAVKYGAVASLVRSIGTANYRLPHTGGMRYVDSDDEGNPKTDPAKAAKIPAAAVTAEDADLIHRLLSRGERVRMRLVLTPKQYPNKESANVVAELRGREKPEEIVLLGAHLDSWDLGTGAIDNGSGVVMVMETMRLLKQLGITPRRTIRAVLYMNEENGLRGGFEYFKAHRAELPQYVAALESDTGAETPVGFRSSGDEATFEFIRELIAPLEAVGVKQVRYEKETGADTSPLQKRGVLGFGLLQNAQHYFDYHHTRADTLDKIDPAELRKNAAAFAFLAHALAETPHRERLVKRKEE